MASTFLSAKNLTFQFRNTPVQSNNIYDHLRGGWAHNLSTETLNALIGQSKMLDCETGHLVFRRGDPSDGFYAVLSGQVRFSRETDAGLELLLTILGPGTTFGDLSSISRRARSHRAVCDAPCRLLYTPLMAFRSLLNSYADFASLITVRMAERTQDMFDMIEDQMLLNVPCRLAKRLVTLARSMNGSNPPPEVTTLRVTQDDLAKLIGASRQSISSHLLAWQKQGLIHQAYGHMQILDLASLQALSRNG